jgi:lipid II:glycine glycyltransferase (peptidoglycan interpeptide bridge formation enzyme)
VIIVRQGSTARYFLGATDPARKDVPVLHLGIFEAIRKSQAMECAAFDFWGYNVYAEEGEQIYHINRFKKWFSGSLLFYPKIMHFHIRPARYAAFQVLLAARERLRGIVGRPAGA